jgi:hypothetical protein
VHPPADDIVGRRLGAMAGIAAYDKATGYFTGKPRSGVGIGGIAGGGGSGSIGWLDLLLLAGFLGWRSRTRKPRAIV